jgi:small neutral amino acid transporter SnatA (MarC family)
MIPSRVFTFFTATLFFYLAIDVVKIILSKQLKHRLTPVNIYKIKRVISFILIIFGVFFLLQGVFPGFKEKVVHKIEETQ